MKLMTKITARLLMEIFPDSDNAYEALDKFSRELYKRISLKMNANIDYTDDLELYLFLQGYKSEIIEWVARNYLKEAKKC